MKTSRRDFVKHAAAGAVALGAAGITEAQAARVLPEDWESYFPSPPKVLDRLDQVMFETGVPEDRFGQTQTLT